MDGLLANGRYYLCLVLCRSVIESNGKINGFACHESLHPCNKHGFYFAVCDMNSHKKCVKHVPDLCGCDYTERLGRIRITAIYEESTGTLSVTGKMLNVK